MKIKVELKTGKTIEILESEIKGLRDAGLLKESKISSETKEEKEIGGTKDEKAPSPITTKNIKGQTPKKVK